MRKYTFLIFFSSLLLVFSFPNFNFSSSFYAFVGFVPLFFALQKKSSKESFWIAYSCGFIFYLGVLYWLYHVTSVGLIILCLYLALYFGIFGFLFNKFAFTLYPSPFTIFFIPIIWTCLEWLQSHLFTGFGWASLGYTQYKNISLIQIADISGVFGVSFVIMLVNIAVYKAFKRSFREIMFAALILLMVFVYGEIKLDKKAEGDSVKVSVIQGNIPQGLKWDPDETEFIISRYIDLTRLSAFDKPDLIVWPETSFPGFFISDKDLTDRVIGLAKNVRIPILLGTNTEKGFENFNSALLISKTGELAGQYDKIHLVPFGEYVPFSDKIPILHDLVLGVLGEFTAGKEYSAFSLEPRAFSGDIKFATLICFEDMFPRMSREFVKNGARFLIVITNDAWYGKSGAAYQHTAGSVFRAIENRVPIVRCANTGYSCFIDSYGRIVDAVEENSANLFITGHKTAIIKLHNFQNK
ncbi:MAG: apolipoprotein N-acyltransferase [Candidatus Omnitrophica bacterium]|nr:apolipoprotein N-acyltransferase [Candidatus Omnitrophota bacterium]